MPVFEQGFGHEEVAGWAGVNTVGNELGGIGGIECVGLGERGDYRGVQVGDLQLLSGSEVFEEIAIAAKDVVVAALKEGSASDIVVRGGLDQSDAGGGKLALEDGDDVAHAFVKVVEDGLVESAVAGVVHAEHDRDDSWIVGEDIAPETDIHGTAATARDTVAAPAGVCESDVRLREARDDIGFGEGGVKALVGDGIAEENNAVVGFEGEGRLGVEGSCEGQNQK